MGWACVGDKKMRQTNGISLLKLLLVLAILGVMAVLTSPNPAF
jgi:Tfp pilus assembly protein FimT